MAAEISAATHPDIYLNRLVSFRPERVTALAAIALPRSTAMNGSTPNCTAVPSSTIEPSRGRAPARRPATWCRRGKSLRCRRCRPRRSEPCRLRDSFGDQPGRERAQNEAHQVAAGRRDQRHQTALASGENGRAGHADRQVLKLADRPEAATEHQPGKQHEQHLQGHGDRPQGDLHQSAEGGQAGEAGGQQITGPEGSERRFERRSRNVPACSSAVLSVSRECG